METKTVSTMVIDDDPDALELLCRLLETDPRIQIKAREVSAVRALKRLKSEPVELLLLDADMPELSGIELAASLHPKPRIIFTTGYPHYAMDAYDLGLDDCIQKPVTLARLSKALHRALGQLWQPEIPEAEPHVLIVREAKTQRYIRLPHTDVLYLVSDKNYVNAYTAQDTYTIRSTLRELRRQLSGQQFIQVHKSFLVNKAKVSAFCATDQQVFLKGVHQPIAISRHFMHAFRKWFQGIPESE